MKAALKRMPSSGSILSELDQKAHITWVAVVGSMSFLKLAVPIVLLALVPLANAQFPVNPNPPPSQAGAIKITNVGPINGLIRDDNMDVIPFKGNVTVPVSVSIDCQLIAYEIANKGNSDIDHFHIQPADGKLPSWLVADEYLTFFNQTAPGVPAFPTSQCGSGTGTYTTTVNYPFAVTAAAPGVTPQVLNLTANLGDNAFATPVSVNFNVQFHANYTVTPSVQVPLTVTGKSANFTVAIANSANARSMVMVEQVHASTGTFSGLGSVPYVPPQTMTFPVTFKAPDSCWTTATVDFHTASHFLLLNQQAGSYRDERTYTYQFHNGIACTPGKANTSKSSPVGGLVVLPAVLGAALLARRRLL